MVKNLLEALDQECAASSNARQEAMKQSGTMKVKVALRRRLVAFRYRILYSRGLARLEESPPPIPSPQRAASLYDVSTSPPESERAQSTWVSPARKAGEEKEVIRE